MTEGVTLEPRFAIFFSEKSYISVNCVESVYCWKILVHINYIAVLFAYVYIKIYINPLFLLIIYITLIISILIIFEVV